MYITVSNQAFRSVALKLTDWENHRTDPEYENALVFKLFVVQFLNSYATLYYVAFFKVCDSGPTANAGPFLCCTEGTASFHASPPTPVAAAAACRTGWRVA